MIVCILLFVAILLTVCHTKVWANSAMNDMDATEAAGAPTGTYTAEQSAVIGHSVKRYHNRPLYCNRMAGVVLGGDLPHIRFGHEPYVCGCLMLAISRGSTSKWLHDFANITSRYHNAHMMWDISDPSMPDVFITLEVVPMADAPGFCARLVPKGLISSDKIIWAYGGATQRPPSLDGSGTIAGCLDPTVNPAWTTRGFVADDCKGNTVNIAGDTFLLTPPLYDKSTNVSQRTIIGRCSVHSAPVIVDANAWTNAATLVKSSKMTESPMVSGVIIPRKTESEFVWAVESSDKGAAFKRSRIDNPKASFLMGMKRAESIGNQIAVNTPDDRFNASVNAVCAAVDGIIRPPYIMHGAMLWNMPYMGWRTLYGPTALGWHSNVKETVKTYLDTQLKSSPNSTPKADSALGYSQEAVDSRMYGRGHLAHPHQYRYDMQSVFFDMAIHAWRWTGDPELERLLGKTLPLHLEWMHDCFDPDDDGLYESYQNTAEVDQVWYNGGGTAEETAYAYNGHLAAMDIARKTGDTISANKHKQQAEKIRASFLQNLWISEKGHVGAYKEQGGLKRLHEDSWLYSIFLPIDARLLTSEQSYRALYYTEWGLERVKMPLGGERCWTSNWVPGAWSNRMLWPPHAYSLALAYYQTGLPDDGWQMMRGGFLESAFNKVVPGGFDCDSVGTDFHDTSSMFARATVEGLFGYQPDYPNSRVRFAPQFPSEWNHASIKTPDFSLAFSRSANKDEYHLKLKQAGYVEFAIPVRAQRVTAVEVDGHKVAWQDSPGYGHSVISVKLPKRKSVNLIVKWETALPEHRPVFVDGMPGQSIMLSVPQGKIISVDDPAQVLLRKRHMNGSVKSVLDTKPGYFAATALVKYDNLQQWQVYKLHVGDTTHATLTEIPNIGKWMSVNIAGQINSDVREIYKKEYLTPRPQTCSVRLGTNGYSSWAWYYWGATQPEIDLSLTSKMLDSTGQLVTPQGIPFKWTSEVTNIAFTSQWDNWPHSVEFPVNVKGQAIWFLVCGSTNCMQGRISNAVISLNYEDGSKQKIDLVPPFNFWNLCPIAGTDYDYKRDAFALPIAPPATVKLGNNCRAILISNRLSQGIILQSVTLEALSQEVVIGIMGITVLQ